MTDAAAQAEKLFDQWDINRIRPAVEYALQAKDDRIAALEAEIARLRTCVMWSVENDGECLGDWPKLLDRARAALQPEVKP